MISTFAFIGTAAAAYYTNASSTTTTLDQTFYTTIECPSPTAFEYGSSTFYVTEPTTLTVEQCECTKNPVSHSALPASSSHSWKPTAIPSAATESVTESVTNYVTIPCSSSTILTYGTGTYTVSEATTLTLEDCSCTDKPSAIGPLPTSVAPKPAPSASEVTNSPSLSSTTTAESTSPVGLASTPSVAGTASIPSIAGTTTTEKSTKYISIPCSSTTLTYNSQTYTVSDLTTLTLEDCSCTESAPLPKTTSPATAAAASSTASAPSSSSSSSNPSSSASPVPVASSSKSAVPSIANGGSLNKVGVAGILMVVANLI